MKYLPIKKEDIEGAYDINLNAPTVSYKEMFVKIKKRAYRCTKAGDCDWYCQRIDDIPWFPLPKDF